MVNEPCPSLTFVAILILEFNKADALIITTALVVANE